MRALRDVVGQAVYAIRANPLRSVLGGLAVAFAVATIAVVITALDGIALYARTSTARTFGSDTFVLAKIASTGQISRRDLADKLQRHQDIRRADLRFLERYAEGQVLYAPSAQRPADAVNGGRKFERAAVTGTSAALDRIRDVGLDRGRFIRPDEDARAAQVAVIGADIADALFPGRDPLGGTLRIAGRGYRVIGTLARVGSSGGSTLDRYIWVPLTAFERTFGEVQTLQLFVKAADVSRTADAEDQVRATMRARRGLGPGVRDTFDILSPDAARGFVARITGQLGAAAYPISAMALLAGIIVITNTTLVSVTQRTREIGVRRAIGATRVRVVLEVLAEASLISVLGGLAGLLVVYVAVNVLTALLQIPFDLRVSTIQTGFFAALVSGLVAGWYPARRAAQVEVVTALRSE